MTQLHIVEHKLYLNVFNFVSNFLLEILLYGKYELIDTKIDLSFKKSFRTIDDYINFATKQLILSLQQHFVEYQLNKEHTQIHEIYDMIDQLRGNPNMLYDIEHIFRKIFPFSIFIVEKDNFVEHYFELLECYVEYSTLIRLQEIKTAEPEDEIVEDEVELVEPTEEKEPKESIIVEENNEQEKLEETPDSEPEESDSEPEEKLEETPDSEPEEELEETPEKEPEESDSEPEEELVETLEKEPEEKLVETPEKEPEEELVETLEKEPEEKLVETPEKEPEDKPTDYEPKQTTQQEESESEDNASTTSSVQKVNPVREIVKDVLQKPTKRKLLPFTPEDRVYTLEELNMLSRENVRRIGTSKQLKNMVKYRKGEVIDLILKKQEGKLDEISHVLRK
jgi:hypothetical protein